MLQPRPWIDDDGGLWPSLRDQARSLKATSPCMAPALDQAVLQRSSFPDALAHVLVQALSAAAVAGQDLRPTFAAVMDRHPEISSAAAVDLARLAAINPACPNALTGLLSFRGYQAIQLYRINHALWHEGQKELSVILQNWGAIVFAMDIHPAARIGSGVFFDHGIGTVIGATSVVEDGANIWHGVTLGSTLTQAGDRHPKVRRNVTIGAGATLLGNIEIGEGAVIAASSVVLRAVEPGSVVAGIPAKVVGQAHGRLDAIDADMKQVSS